MSHTVWLISYGLRDNGIYSNDSYGELHVRYLEFNNTNVVPTLIICQTRLGDYIAKFNDKIKVSDDSSAVTSIYYLLTVSQTLQKVYGYFCRTVT